MAWPKINMAEVEAEKAERERKLAEGEDMSGSLSPRAKVKLKSGDYSEADMDIGEDDPFSDDAMTSSELADKMKYQLANPGMQTAIITMHAFDKHIHYHLEAHPQYARANFWVEVVAVNILIFVAAISVILQTVCDPDRDMVEGNGTCYDPVKEPDREFLLGLTTLKTFWGVLDHTCFAVFGMEWVFRFGGSIYIGSFTSYRKDIMNWVDLISILPFYLELIFQAHIKLDTRFVRAMRLARITSSLKTMRFGNMNDIIANILNSSLGALTIPIFFMALAAIVFACVMYFAEGGAWYCCPYRTEWNQTEFEHRAFNFGDCEATLLTAHCGEPTDCVDMQTVATAVRGASASNQNPLCMATSTMARFKMAYDGTPASGHFDDIPAAVWWCVVTFTTVGYGDKFAITTWGQFVNSFAMFMGIFFLAMPVAIIGDAFQYAWKGMKAKNRAADAKRRLIKGEWQPDLKKLQQVKLDIVTHLRHVKRSVETFRDDKSDLEKHAWDDALHELTSFQVEFNAVWSTYNIDIDELKEQMSHKLDMLESLQAGNASPDSKVKFVNPIMDEDVRSDDGRE